MQAASLPASAGWLWIHQGYQLFRRQPMPMFTWALTIGLLVLVASMLVPIGPGLFILLMPAISVMTLNACRQVVAGDTVRPLQLWRLLGQPGMAKRLVGMGGIYLLGIIAAGVLGFLPFFGNLGEAAQLAEAENTLEPLLAAIRGPLLLSGLLYLLLAALFWHAPVLVAWHGMGLRKALFFSGIACWRNKGAFVVYGLLWGAVIAGVEVLAYVMQAIGIPILLVNLVQMPLSFAIAAVLYCSFYPTYTTVFGDPDAPEARD